MFRIKIMLVTVSEAHITNISEVLFVRYCFFVYINTGNVFESNKKLTI